VRLGCINHALLSAAAIHARGLRLAGWIANGVDPHMEARQANVEDLARRLPAPLVANFAWGASPAMAPAALDVLGLR